MVINSIVEALRRRDLGPALSWAEQRTDQLHQIVSRQVVGCESLLAGERWAVS